MLREVLIFVAVFAAFASAVAAYLYAFHGTSSPKEVLSTAFTGTVGVALGRLLERRMARG
ncbi:hypothetical protein [Novosphingobium sp.]|uniref:hypothetical protein n=1 Tax=Novosphingobium sp. TaxID=1874826 RepID=UPI002735B5DA|nr:hypothetical protein [Novosphingobium sp.]MDP3906058.1 hypothetical protein [Novosphingobium sp.]